MNPVIRSLTPPAMMRFFQTLRRGLGLALAIAAGLRAADRPMNIVVLLADDWRYDTLGVAGIPW